MKIEEACIYAKAMGLHTIDKAVLNIHRFCMSLFVYEDIAQELRELHTSWKNTCLPKDAFVKQALTPEVYEV